MTKAELTSIIAQETGLTKADAQKAVTSLVSTVLKTLKKEGRLALYGLGVFETVKRPKRRGRNPRTGEPLTIKAHKAIKFKPAKQLKESLNNGK
ncbi:MAG: HU family DNA-binding protein [Deltaproteobacteria bacterium]|jgi:DNA-binding protein HU-beta|nr:HU family DNA-binding protein [Deltaproteobacteria bacterium]